MRPKKNKKGKKAITNAQASLGFTRPHHLLIGQQHCLHERDESCRRCLQNFVLRPYVIGPAPSLA